MVAPRLLATLGLPGLRHAVVHVECAVTRVAEMRETPWQSQVVDAFRRLGGDVTVLGHPRRRVRCPVCGADATDYHTQQTEGTPDLLVCWPRLGTHQAVEVKARGGRVTDAQRAWHRMARASGLTVRVVWTMDDVIAAAIDAGVPVHEARRAGTR